MCITAFTVSSLIPQWTCAFDAAAGIQLAQCIILTRISDVTRARRALTELSREARRAATLEAVRARRRVVAAGTVATRAAQAGRVVFAVGYVVKFYDVTH